MAEQSRQLAAIMYTDMVGYTGIMQQNESLALNRIEQYKLILNHTVTKHNGRIQQYYGDGSLITFDSALNAIQCGINIMEDSSKEKIPLRIGLHLGEIIWKNGTVYGDGLNIASRIESLGIKGSILISGSVYEQIHNQPEIKLKSLGWFKLKNVQLPMKIYSVSNNGFPAPGKGHILLKSHITYKCRPVIYFEYIFRNLASWIWKKK